MEREREKVRCVEIDREREGGREGGRDRDREGGGRERERESTSSHLPFHSEWIAEGETRAMSL
jgi:hypothetical protein